MQSPESHKLVSQYLHDIPTQVLTESSRIFVGKLYVHVGFPVEQQQQEVVIDSGFQIVLFLLTYSFSPL